MRVVRSENRRPKKADADVAAVLRGVSPDRLRQFVEMISFPRHAVADRRANVAARDLLVQQLREFGYAPRLQGVFDNIVATTDGAGPFVLLGAHYDSVPGTPGADDNGSAVAVVLECARLVREHCLGPVMVAFFNREEDGLLGSREFVAGLKGEVNEAHIFEMVGYCDRTPGSQRMPPGLPGVVAPDVGDFLALLSNRHSNPVAEKLVSLSATYVPQPAVFALKVFMGVEKYFGHLLRSDHAPFWQAGIPAVMWTDTSEFRNPHYHQPTDTPDTLDYEFMAGVTRLALARVATHS